MPLPITEQLLACKLVHQRVYDLEQIARRWGILRTAEMRKLLEDAVEREKINAGEAAS